MRQNTRYVPKAFPLWEFTGRLMKGGGVSAGRLFLLPAYYFRIIAELPFAWLSSLFCRRKIRNTQVTCDPLFILGHYRSGTSLLQKLMASDRRFGYLTYYDALFPNISPLSGRIVKSIFQGIINTFTIKNPFFHDTVLQLDEPDEEDDYLMNKGSPFSAYWGMVFPKKWREWLNGSPQMENKEYETAWKKEYQNTIRFLTMRNQGRPLILKSPPNTGRIRILTELFPRAKFIFLYRNPADIWFSNLNMWKNVILKYYSLQTLDEDEIRAIIFGHFEWLTEQYESDKRLIREGQLMEVAYESLKRDPMGTVRSIYQRLDLPDFEVTADNLKKQIEKENEYRNFNHKRDREMVDEIHHRWKSYFLRWGYDLPDETLS